MILPSVTPPVRGLVCLLLALSYGGTAVACDTARTVMEADPHAIRAFFAGKQMRVLTFLGFSGAEYENPAAMLEQASRVLKRYEPSTTLVNGGATVAGIGAVYETAKARGFLTTGIVSVQARKHEAPLSPCVDVVFFVKDESWGGFLPGTTTLSPTSTAMVENSDILVAIGGGDVARDELIAAQRLGKRVEFIAADMNHRLARDKALQKSQPVPTDFRGTAAAALNRVR